MGPIPLQEGMAFFHGQKPYFLLYAHAMVPYLL